MKDYELLALAAGGFLLLEKTGVAQPLGQAIGQGIGQTAGSTATGVVTGVVQGYYQTIWNAQDWLYKAVFGKVNPFSGNLHG